MGVKDRVILKMDLCKIGCDVGDKIEIHYGRI
jgi:hypothetical protein